MQLSYCITCYNRYEQLQKTLLKNLSTIKETNNTRIILVNFNGNDNKDITNFIDINCKQYINNGNLIYYIYKDNFEWCASIAKNVAHRLASDNDIVINLDCDNFIPPNNDITIRNIFNENKDVILHQSKYNKNTYLFIKGLIPDFHTDEINDEQHEIGDVGRVVMTKQNFLKIGGYDENMKFISFEDTDILIRGISIGLKYRHVYDECDITNIPNPKNTETEEYKTKWWYNFNKNKYMCENNIQNNILCANVSGFNEKLEDYNLYNYKLEPYYIHFIFFGLTEFTYMHYISVISAKKYNPNAIINIFYYKKINNEYWNKLEDICNFIFTIPPEICQNNPIDHYQYKADFLRLEILYAYGGIYLDIDVITLKSYENLLKYECCIGGEKYIDDKIQFSNKPSDFCSITNAVIICKKHNKFIHDWLNETNEKYMCNNIWAWHAVLLPLEIIKRGKYDVHIEPVESFIPFDFRNNSIFNDKMDISLSNSYCFHLWETIWNNYLEEMNKGKKDSCILGKIIGDILTIK